MSRLRPIHGACNCGRNLYSITVPKDALEQAEVYFDDSSESSKLFSLQPADSNLLVKLIISYCRTKSGDASNCVATYPIAVVLFLDPGPLP